MRIGGYGRVPQGDVNLANMSQAHMMALSQQGNASHEQLLEMQAAQQGMQEISKQNIEVPKVNFYPSRHPDPRKARKQDIRSARRLLTPTKRKWYSPLRWIWGRKYRYNRQSNLCVIDGCDCEELIKYDNLYAKITDEVSGKSLWEMYWKNPVTNAPEAFVAREQVTNGRKMKGTYCPEHLHLYHLLCKWESEADKDHNKTSMGMKEMVKKGVSTVAVPIAVVKKKDNTPQLLKKYEPFFMQLEKDSKAYNGINLLHYKNPETGINDVTMIVFDLRLFQQEMANMSPTLSDAITQLGINQAPQPSVAQSLPQENANGVINQDVLPQTEQGIFTQSTV
tara:strand:+ start:2671 stop:3681 length:1011 start_codon:yes stop_codon:yes gene_type:complete